MGSGNGRSIYEEDVDDSDKLKGQWGGMGRRLGFGV
jgi:hypothetical protein